MRNKEMLKKMSVKCVTAIMIAQAQQAMQDASALDNGQ
jgi:hypothetical protein